MKHNENISLSVGPKHGELDIGKLLRSHVTLRTCLAAVDNCKQLQRIKSYSKKKVKSHFFVFVFLSSHSYVFTLWNPNGSVGSSLAMFDSLDFHLKKISKCLPHSLPGIVLAACQSSSLSRERAVQSYYCLSPCR